MTGTCAVRSRPRGVMMKQCWQKRESQKHKSRWKQMQSINETRCLVGRMISGFEQFNPGLVASRWAAQKGQATRRACHLRGLFTRRLLAEQSEGCLALPCLASLRLVLLSLKLVYGMCLSVRDSGCLAGRPEEGEVGKVGNAEGKIGRRGLGREKQMGGEGPGASSAGVEFGRCGCLSARASRDRTSEAQGSDWEKRGRKRGGEHRHGET